MSTTMSAGSLLQQLRDYEASALAHQPDLDEDAGNRWDGLAFRLQQHELCVDVVLIDEIIPPPRLTPVPGSADWLLGLTNVRGSLVTIIDLRLFLFQERTPISSKSQVLITSADNHHTGLLVDEILGQRHFDIDSASAVDAELWPGISPYLGNVYAQNDVRWGVLDLPQLLHDQRFLDGAA
ncbi:MAG: chemotaxis protein CheW [Gammaproteobacteria bacterium]|nr:chemotaxis protein CheW [Gammaproteobacteria bacterium]